MMTHHMWVILNNDVPNLRNFIKTKLVDDRLAEKEKEDKAYKDREKMNKVMGHDDFWNLYDPIVKTRIYKFIVEKNCKKLQEEFDTAADMADRKHSSGIRASKELELMDFIDSKMDDIGCY